MNTHPAPSPLPAGGWFWIDNQLLDRFGPRLGVYGLAVYTALARCANRERECHPSYQRIADAIGCSRRQVIREMARLESLGLVTKIERTTARGDAGANGYRLLCLAPPQPQPDQTSDSQSPPAPEATAPGDPVSPLVTGGHYPSDSGSPEVVTETTGGGDSQSPKQDLKNKTQSEEDPENKQPPQTLTGPSCTGAAGTTGGSVLFSLFGAEGEPTADTGERAEEPAEETAEEATPAQVESPVGGYSLARFVQVTGRRPSREERGQLAGLDSRYTETERCYLFDALESAQMRQAVRHPLAYLQAIAQRQARSRWPGLAEAARTQPEGAPNRYTLPAGYISRSLAEPDAEEEPPVLFRRFVDALHGQLYGSPMAGELHGLTHLPSADDTLRVGVPQQRLTAWLQERAGVVVARAARQASPALGVTVEFVWVG